MIKKHNSRILSFKYLLILLSMILTTNSLLGRQLLVSSLFSTSAYAQVVVPPTPFIDIEYSYDGAGNVTATLDHINLQNSHTMQYDSLDRLSGANGPWGPSSFNYDAIGNRLNKSIDTTNQNYSYGSVDNLLDGYAHDVNGNVLGDGSFTYVYDSENRLIRVLSNGSVIVEYSYDGDGRRISKTAYGETTYYAYGTGSDVLTEFNAQGVPKRDYVYAGNKNIARVNFDGSGVKQDTSSYHTDHLGSSLAMTDESTTVVWGQTYLPFGDAYRGIGTQNNSHQYTGKEFDQDIGLYYYGARYYHAGLGRFMSVDPAPGVVTDPQSWNRYSYTLNNPYKYVDPDGEAAVNVQGIINLNTQIRDKLSFVPDSILNILLPADPESLVTSSLPGPQAFEIGMVSKVAGLAGLRRSSIISLERTEKFLLSKGFSLSRARDFIDSFEGSITARIAEPGEQFFRYTDKSGSKGSFLTKSLYTSPEDAVISLYLQPYGNTAQLRQIVTSTKRSIVLEGVIKNGASRARQTLIIDREAFEFSLGERF